MPDEPAKPSVALGTHVQIALTSAQSEPEMLDLDVVLDAQADFAHGFLGASTPLARAIMGHAEGEIVRYRAEGVTAVQIVKVTPSATTSAANRQVERQAVIDKAVAQSEILNDAAFALAAGSKWGDYDPAAKATEVIPTAAKTGQPKKRPSSRPRRPRQG